MSWQLLLTISIITDSVSILLQKILLKNDKSDPIAFSILFQVITALVIAVFACLHGFQMPDLLRFWPNVLLMMVSYALMNVFIFLSLKKIEASEFTIIFVTQGIWRVLGAVLALGEKFTMQEVLGTVLIIASVVIIFYQKKKFVMNIGMLYALFGAICFGVAFTNDAFLINHFDVLSYESFAFFLPTFATIIIFPKSVTKLRVMLEARYLVKLTCLSTLYGTAAVTIFYAYKVGHNAAQMSALYQTTTVLTVILSIIFLRETSQLWKKLLGALLAFIGIVLIG